MKWFGEAMEIWDAHITLGPGLETQLSLEDILASMDANEIVRAVVTPADRFLAVRNIEGNRLTCAAALAHPDRLIAAATVNPWLEEDALGILRSARDAGARLLWLDAPHQGFDLLSGLADPAIDFAVAAGWPIFLRPASPGGLPLQLAEVALRFPLGRFILAGGVGEFEFDIVPAMKRAANLFADTAWMGEVLADTSTGPARLVFASDAPYSDPSLELAKVTETLQDAALAGVMSTNLATLLRLSPG